MLKLVRRGRVMYVDGDHLRAGAGACGATRNCCGQSHLNGKGSGKAGSERNGTAGKAGSEGNSGGA